MYPVCSGLIRPIRGGCNVLLKEQSRNLYTLRLSLTLPICPGQAAWYRAFIRREVRYRIVPPDHART